MRIVDKPWGHEVIWAETADYVGKILHIEEGEQLSLQYHEVKEEKDRERERKRSEREREGEESRERRTKKREEGR